MANVTSTKSSALRPASRASAVPIRFSIRKNPANALCAGAWELTPARYSTNVTVRPSGYTSCPRS